jgi:hypothetical protein
MQTGLAQLESRQTIGRLKVVNENQNDQGIVREYGVFSVGAWLVSNSESAAFVEPSHLATEKEAGEINAQATPIQRPQKRSELLPRRRSTGPRTELGKRSSSQNAIKFGIFSKAILLKGESRTEYESLRKALWKSRQPGDEYEEVLLDMIVSNLWRWHRVDVAEVAIIRRSSEFLEFDRRQNERAEAERISQKWQESAADMFALEHAGLIWNIHNPDILKRCIELLVELRQRMRTNGFDEHRDRLVLKKLYGEPGNPHFRPTLNDNYTIWLHAAKTHEKESAEHPTEGVFEQCFLRDIGVEIKRIKQYEEQHKLIESKKGKLEILQQRVPNTPELDRLLRYRKSLEREFDRLMTQYERAQRIRRGQPLPPQLDVKIS